MQSVRNGRASVSRDEIIALVEKMVQQQIQIERSRILELLTEMDRDKTQQMFSLAQIEARVLAKIHEERQNVETETDGRLRRCQDAEKDQFNALAGRVKVLEGVDPNPNFWTIVSLVVGLTLALMGWVYSIHLECSELRLLLHQKYTQEEPLSPVHRGLSATETLNVSGTNASGTGN